MSLYDPVEGCGISTIWMLPSDCWAAPACKWHDEQFELKKAGQQPLSRDMVDQIFLEKLLALANTRFRKVQAYGLYSIARSVGWLYWGEH